MFKTQEKRALYAGKTIITFFGEWWSQEKAAAFPDSSETYPNGRFSIIYAHNDFLHSAIRNFRRFNHTNSARRSSLEGWWGQKIRWRGDLRKEKLTLGEVVAKWRPKNYKNGPEWGPGGPVWAQTRSEWRPGPQDHFPSPPGPKNPI